MGKALQNRRFNEKIKMVIMNKIILICFLFFIISCKKNEQLESYKDLNSKEYFSIPTDLKNMRNIEKSKINDSLYKIKGLFNNYIIKGYMNGDKKIGWWEALDYNTKEIVAKLEYKLIDDKEFVNQYILFKNKSIDTLKSKFYTFNVNKDLVKYKFYMPIRSKELHSSGKLNYKYSIQGKEKTHLESKSIKNRNIYSCEVSVPIDFKSTIIIKGNFWEMFQLDDGNIGENDIYVLDTLN